MNTFDIENPSDTGHQGYAPSHADNPYHKIILAFGYTYSHSTPIGRSDGTAYLHHTYTQHTHCVGISLMKGLTRWETSLGTSTGTRHCGAGQVALEEHLWYKAHRYSELRPQDKALCLAQAQEELKMLGILRQVRSELIRSAFVMYGDHGSLISGIERDHFPADVKDALRKNASDILHTMDAALIYWRRSGRRLHTFLKALHAVPHFDSRY